MESQASPQSPDPGSLEQRLGSIRSLVGKIIKHGSFELSFEIRSRATRTRDDGIEAPEAVVDFWGPDAELLLQAHAELLNALEYVVLKAARLDEDLFGRITFDCEGYRELRVEELKLMAQVAAERVMETHDPYPLGPMSPRERRIVHLALKDQDSVRTLSEGYGAERRVVIMPASRPARR